MSQNITLALDGMGGDHAPSVVVEGASLALERYPGTRFIIYGQTQVLAPLLSKYPKLSQASTLEPTESVVTSDMKPSYALRNGRQSSMGLAIDAVHKGIADGVVSAGNTGALMVISRFVLKMLEGIDRPAIVSLMPTLNGESVMLDLGANVDCNQEHLVQFAIMGEVFARLILGKRHPIVGLLNIGSEEIKGSDTLRQAYGFLKNGPFEDRFYGFVEGNQIHQGVVDVVVTDGFTGNVALKTMEGTAKLIAEFVRRTFKSSWMAKLAYLLSRRSIKNLGLRLDPRRYNGAVMLGVNGIVVKSHGGTDALGFATAIGFAVDLVKGQFRQKVLAEMDKIRNTHHIAPIQL